MLKLEMEVNFDSPKVIELIDVLIWNHVVNDKKSKENILVMEFESVDTFFFVAQKIKQLWTGIGD